MGIMTHPMERITDVIVDNHKRFVLSWIQRLCQRPVRQDHNNGQRQRNNHSCAPHIECLTIEMNMQMYMQHAHMHDS
jgi:hypothetical protein